MMLRAEGLILPPWTNTLFRRGRRLESHWSMLRLRSASLFLVAALLVVFGFAAARAHDHDDLLPRKVIFGNPERSAPMLSPDGEQMAFTAPVDGVMNLWVGPTDDVEAARPVTEETERPIMKYWWASNGTHLLYMKD